MTDLLQADLIKAAFPNLRVRIFDEVESTNTLLMDDGQQAAGQLVLAEGQSQGKGRRAKVWLSPYARSLSMSLARSTRRSLLELGGLSTIIGVALCEQIRQMGAPAELKWPNDVHIKGAKLCGILVELSRQDDGVVVVIGVGVNVDLQDAEISAIDQPVTDLRRHGVTLNRTELAIRLMSAVDQLVDQFEVAGFATFVERFDALHALHNEPCTVHIGDRQVHGTVLGIADDGALRVSTEQGAELYHGGEVSLRRKD
ncbi:MAG: biotin--[acetyl-CoA-carboxylase] ligase [Pseudomonadales bacterium]